ARPARRRPSATDPGTAGSSATARATSTRTPIRPASSRATSLRSCRTGRTSSRPATGRRRPARNGHVPVTRVRRSRTTLARRPASHGGVAWRRQLARRGVATPRGVAWRRRLEDPGAEGRGDELDGELPGRVLTVEDRVDLDDIHRVDEAELGDGLEREVRLALREASAHRRSDAGGVLGIDYVHVEGDVVERRAGRVR